VPADSLQRREEVPQEKPLIDSYGNVHPDQFWQSYSLGNVKEKPFSEIWSDAGNSFLNNLRDRNQRLTGRCQACRWKPLCGGSFRVRAFQATGDLWASDPACYLTDEEVSLSHVMIYVIKLNWTS
jgi:radical SAM protein with 4Fe4S-binding SPASM domain